MPNLLLFNISKSSLLWFDRWDNTVARVRSFLKDRTDATSKTEAGIVREVDGPIWSIRVILVLVVQYGLRVLYFNIEDGNYG